MPRVAAKRSRMVKCLVFTSDFDNYTFENGTTKPVRNLAAVEISFDGINSGQALFDSVNLPISTIESTTTSAEIITTTPLIGYPTTILMHRDCYTSGQFLLDSNVAVLAVEGILDPADTDPEAPRIQSEVMASFLSFRLKNNKTQSIVVVQAN